MNLLLCFPTFFHGLSILSNFPSLWKFLCVFYRSSKCSRKHTTPSHVYCPIDIFLHPFVTPFSTTYTSWDPIIPFFPQSLKIIETTFFSLYISISPHSTKYIGSRVKLSGIILKLFSGTFITTPTDCSLNGH